MKINEEWRSVPGYEGEYEVSESGKVKSLYREIDRKTRSGKPGKQIIHEKILLPGRSSNGYCTVSLGRKNSFCLHELVARAFLGKKPEGLEICHIDGDKTNNHYSNLRYDSRSENNRDISRHGKRKITKADADYIREVSDSYDSQKSAWISLGYNISYGYFSRIYNNKGRVET